MPKSNPSGCLHYEPFKLPNECRAAKRAQEPSAPKSKSQLRHVIASSESSESSGGAQVRWKPLGACGELKICNRIFKGVQQRAQVRRALVEEAHGEPKTSNIVRLPTST